MSEHMNRRGAVQRWCVAFGLVAACGGEATTSGSGSAAVKTASASTQTSVLAPSAASSAPPPVESSAATTAGLPCKVDSDCRTPACGPCTPGTPITRETLSGPECYRNPCKNPGAACASGQCVIGPKTEKDPAVFGSAKPR